MTEEQKQAIIESGKDYFPRFHYSEPYQKPPEATLKGF